MKNIAPSSSHSVCGRVIAVLAAAFVLLTVARPGLAQAPSADELRREVDRLTRQVEAIQAQLTAAQQQLADAKAENARLQDQLKAAWTTMDEMRRRGPGAAAATPPEARAPVPADPLAAPASLFAELLRRYASEVATLPHAPDNPDPAVEAKFRDAVERWCKTMNRTVRGKGTWLMRLDDVWLDPRTDTWSALCRVVDEKTRLPIGDAFRRPIPAKFTDRIDRDRKTRPPDSQLWRVTLLVVAAPRFNPDRLEPGPYNEPPFIGRYAEFGYEIDWQGIAPLEKPEASPGAPTGSATGATGTPPATGPTGGTGRR